MKREAFSDTPTHNLHNNNLATFEYISNDVARRLRIDSPCAVRTSIRDVLLVQTCACLMMRHLAGERMLLYELMALRERRTASALAYIRCDGGFFMPSTI